MSKFDKISRQLKPFFNPKTIAVIGASSNPKKVGYGVIKNLRSFKGKIIAINPKRKEILGINPYPSLLDVPEKIDLAVISIPAKSVPQAIKDCANKGIKTVIIISAGFGETGEEGKKLQEKFLQTAKENKIRIVGPNCLGILYPPNSLNASFGPALPPSGKVAFISQSGALADSVIDWSLREKYGFSAIVSYGNKSNLDAPDFIAWAGKDPYTKAIALYIEGFTDGRYFLQTAQEVSKIKPIISMKAGRSSAATKAISSHTGSLAGAYNVYKGAYRQSGVIMADTLSEMFALSKSLSMQSPAKGNRIAIVTNGGGCGIMAVDYCEELNISLPQPSKEMIRRIDDKGVLHPAWSRRCRILRLGFDVVQNV